LSVRSPVAQTLDTDRPSPVNGLLSIGFFLAMFILGALINSLLSTGGTYPVPDDTVDRVMQWRMDNGSSVRLTGVVGALAGLGLIWHGAWLSTVVRHRTRNREAALVVFGGGMVAGTFMLIAGMLQWVIESPETLAEPALTRAVDRIIYATSGPGSVVGFLFLAGAAGLAFRRTNFLPQWFSILGVAAGVLSLVSLSLLLPEDGSAFGVVSGGRFPAILWLLAAAILINRRLKHERVAP
jgi:hypothetical protein